MGRKFQKCYGFLGTPFTLVNNSTFTIDYLQVPALLKIKLGPAYVMTGFTGSVRVGGKVETDGVTEELDSDVFSGFNFWNRSSIQLGTF